MTLYSFEASFSRQEHEYTSEISATIALSTNVQEIGHLARINLMENIVLLQELALFPCLQDLTKDLIKIGRGLPTIEPLSSVTGFLEIVKNAKSIPFLQAYQWRKLAVTGIACIRQLFRGHGDQLANEEMLELRRGLKELGIDEGQFRGKFEGPRVSCSSDDWINAYTSTLAQRLLPRYPRCGQLAT